MPGRVDLGLLPPSNVCFTAYWDEGGDGAVLIANALEYVAGGGSGGSGLVTTDFCEPANPNSTGQSTRLVAVASTAATSGVQLKSNQGPPTQFGYFLLGTAASDPGLVLSNGEFCLAVGGSNHFIRYNVAGTYWNSVGFFNSAGVFQNTVGTSASGLGYDLPADTPLAGTTIQAGDTWHFQLWHREAGGASNFSNGVSVTF